MSIDDIEFVDSRERELFAAAKLGEDVRKFLRSDVGRYIHGKAKIDLEDAKEQLLNCNLLTFWGRRKARQLQQKAEVARSVLRYCVDAINDGELAFQELSERENP